MNVIKFCPRHAVTAYGKRIGATKDQQSFARQVVGLDLRAGVSEAMAVHDGKRALRVPSNQGGLVA